MISHEKNIDGYQLIYSKQKLESLINEKGYVNYYLSIQWGIESLGKISKIYGSLNVSGSRFTSFGNLNYVKGDLFVSGRKIETLDKIERVGGNINLSKSNVTDLGKLWRVGGTLNLRDTKINDLSGLKYVKKLLLPMRLKNLNIDHIEVEKVSYFNDSVSDIYKDDLWDVGGRNLSYNLNVKKENIFEYSGEKYIDTGHDIIFSLNEWKIPTNPLSNYYISEDEVLKNNNNYIFYKLSISGNPNYLQKYKDSYEISKLRNRLIFDLIESFGQNSINLEKFIDETIYYEKVFESFNTPKLEFFNLYNKLGILDRVYDLIQNNKKELSYGQIHDMEIKEKKRFFSGKIVVKEVSSLNGYIQENISDYCSFIDKKLDEIYKDNYSLIESLFGTSKSVNELNNEFPKRNLDLKNGLIFIENNKEKEPFLKYFNGLKKFETNNLIKLKNKLFHGGEIYLNERENPLEQKGGGYYGKLETDFCYFIENIINKIFIYITIKYQDEFRVSKGLPKIGEGWISETDLFYKLKNKLTNIDLIHHGKPKWLGKQHVDIWIPKYKIGIEYQGKQHFKPVDFFGGKEGFIKNIERDKRKRNLFLQNDSILIEVKKGYNLDELVETIFNYIKKKDGY